MTPKTAQSAQRRRHAPHQGAGPCQAAFVKGQADRQAYPLLSGLYKLREAQRGFDQIRITVESIQLWARGGTGAANHLVGLLCVAEEKGRWLKGRPAAFSFSLGYDVLPAVAALAGDGLPLSKVAKLSTFAKGRAQSIVADCAAVGNMLRCNIDAEYAAMRAGGSHILPLVSDVQALLATLIDTAANG